MTAARAATPAMPPASRPRGGAAGAAHVLGARAAADAATARLAPLTDPDFLAEAGWDRTARVLSLPPEHKKARETGKTQLTGHLRRWWQVLGSNQRRLSRRF